MGHLGHPTEKFEKNLYFQYTAERKEAYSAAGTFRKALSWHVVAHLHNTVKIQPFYKKKHQPFSMAQPRKRPISALKNLCTVRLPLPVSIPAAIPSLAQRNFFWKKEFARPFLFFLSRDNPFSATVLPPDENMIHRATYQRIPTFLAGNAEETSCTE